MYIWKVGMNPWFADCTINEIINSKLKLFQQLSNLQFILNNKICDVMPFYGFSLTVRERDDTSIQSHKRFAFHNQLVYVCAVQFKLKLLPLWLNSSDKLASVHTVDWHSIFTPPNASVQIVFTSVSTTRSIMIARILPIISI